MAQCFPAQCSLVPRPLSAARLIGLISYTYCWLDVSLREQPSYANSCYISYSKTFILGKMRVDIVHIAVDLTESGRRLLHAVVDLPVQSNKTASFATPLWIQEHHANNGPVPGISGLSFTVGAGSGGKSVPWRRNPMAASEFFVDIPDDVHTIRATFDAIVTQRVTRRMVALAWEAVLLYPTDRPIEKTYIKASVTIPREWGIGTALRPDGGAVVSTCGTTKTFQYEPTTVERLEDSPVLTGLYFREFALTSDQSHLLCVAADTEAYADVHKANLATVSRLVDEVLAITGVRHYRTHRFLVTLSNHAGGGGYEHAESFDAGVPLTAFSDPKDFDQGIEISAHEYFHSWCGKYRRPSGHRPHDFQTPLDGRLLWVYEGLTQYYGEVLSVRSGGMTPETYRAKLANTAARMDSQGGRRWRSIEDTGTGTSIRPLTTAWQNWHRDRGDYYAEGVLVWLTVDTLIRANTGGQHSLDDWVRAFFGGDRDTGPKVVSYTLDDIVESLNTFLEYDWASFFRKHVQEVAPRALVDGIEQAGYRLEYASEPNEQDEVKYLARGKGLEDAIWYSLGLKVSENGELLDVRRYGPSDKAKLAPTQNIVKIGNSSFSSIEQLADAIKRASSEKSPIRLAIHHEDDDWETEIDYNQGLRYPRLVRKTSESDILAGILASRT